MKGILKGIGFFLLYMVLTLVMQTLISMGFMFFRASAGNRSGEAAYEFATHNLLGISIVSAGIIIWIFYEIFHLRKADIRSEWKLKKVPLKDYLLPVLTAFLSSSACTLFTYGYRLNNQIMTEYSANYYSTLVKELGTVILALYLLIFAPVSEEIALRGIVYTRMTKTAHPAIAIILSALMYGMMQFTDGGISLIIRSVVMGIVLGLILLKTDSLFVCILAHTAANLPELLLSGHPMIENNLFVALVTISLIAAGLCAYFLVQAIFRQEAARGK